VVKYVVDRSPKGDKDLLVQEAKHYLSQELQGELMTIAQQWEQEGFKKGMQQGEVTLLKRLLQHRFGDLPAFYAQLIEDANTETLLYWSEKILDPEVKTFEEIFSSGDSVVT
jgi:hypothetical protein